jgi:hypothetical protein
MKAFVGILTVWLAVGPAMVIQAVTEAPDFERYQVILNRLPFGAEPVIQSGPASDAPPGPPAESFAKNLKVCAMTHHHLTGKLQVGLVDTGTKKNYFFKVGDEEDGIRLVDADYDGEKALLRKGTEEVWVKLTDGGGVAVAAAGSRPGLAPAPGMQPLLRSSVPGASPAPAQGINPAGMTTAAPVQPGGLPSVRDRLSALHARRAEMATRGAGATTVPQAGIVTTTSGGTVQGGSFAVSANVLPVAGSVTAVATEGVTSMSAAEKEKEEVMAKRRRLIQSSALSTTNSTLSQNLQNYQMDLIRAGGKKGPPLPIQLSPEADAQLVSEGVLPPQE